MVAVAVVAVAQIYTQADPRIALGVPMHIGAQLFGEASEATVCDRVDSDEWRGGRVPPCAIGVSLYARAISCDRGPTDGSHRMVNLLVRAFRGEALPANQRHHRPPATTKDDCPSLPVRAEPLYRLCSEVRIIPQSHQALVRNLLR